MTTMTATDFARNLSRTLDRLEHGGEEVLVMRNGHPVAKLTPGAPQMKTLDAFADLFGVLPDEEGGRWLKDSARSGGTVAKELSDPWA